MQLNHPNTLYYKTSHWNPTQCTSTSLPHFDVDLDYITHSHLQLVWPLLQNQQSCMLTKKAAWCTLCNLGLPAHLLCWFRSYLSDRFQEVSISSCPSSKAIVSFGVSKGSILGPLLLILCVNDLPKLSFSPNSSLTMYAKDILPTQFIPPIVFNKFKARLTLCHLDSLPPASSLRLMQRKTIIWLLLANPNHLCCHFLHSVSTTFLLNLLHPINI